MTDDMRTLHIPTSKELITELETCMHDEEKRSPTPVVLEAYCAGILANFVFNVKFQREAQAYEKQLQSDIRDKMIRWTDQTLRALTLERK